VSESLIGKYDFHRTVRENMIFCLTYDFAVANDSVTGLRLLLQVFFLKSNSRSKKPNLILRPGNEIGWCGVSYKSFILFVFDTISAQLLLCTR
jgi:hypothetical protein